MLKFVFKVTQRNVFLSSWYQKLYIYIQSLRCFHCFRSSSEEREVSKVRHFPFFKRGYLPQRMVPRVQLGFASGKQAALRTQVSGFYCSVNQFYWIHVFYQCCGAAGGAEIIWDPEAKLNFLINIFCGQFGGCQDEDKLISTSISIVLLFQNSFKCQYMAVAGAGAGAGAENK